MDWFNSYYLQVAMFVLVHCLVGLSLYMTLSTGQLTLGNAGFMSVGAYTAALLTLKAGVPILLAVVVGGLAAALVALVIGLPTTRLQGLYLAIATLGFGEVVRVVFLNLKVTNGALGLSGIPSLAAVMGKWLAAAGMGTLFGNNLKTGQVALTLFLAFLVVLTLVGWRHLMKSKVGRAFAAIKDDEKAAELTGIHVVYYKMMAFLMGAFVAGVGGGLYAHVTYFINPGDFSYHKVVDILLYVVFGGSNVVYGPILGATVLTVLPEVLRFMADYRELIYGAMLVVLMAVSPDGILTTDRWEKVKEWRKKLGKGGTKHVVDTE